jgi:hypothetical protein
MKIWIHLEKAKHPPFIIGLHPLHRHRPFEALGYGERRTVPFFACYEGNM